MSLFSDLQQLQADIDLFHDVITGDAVTNVDLGGGNLVPTLQKFFASAVVALQNADHSASPLAASNRPITIVLADSTAGAVIVNPPAVPNAPQILIIKDKAGHAVANPITFGGVVYAGEQTAIPSNGGWLIYAWNLADNKWSQIG